MPAPDLGVLKIYLGTSSYSDAQLEQALATEKAAQARVCRVPAADAVWDADIAEALCRRVARNLAMRGIPLAMFSGDSDLGGMVPPNRDPEVRRLEGPKRKLKLG
jgi:hypothetical protein